MNRMHVRFWWGFVLLLWCLPAAAAGVEPELKPATELKAVIELKPTTIAPPGQTGFRVFNAMLYRNQPDFGERLAVVYEPAFFPGGEQRKDGTPTEAGITAAATAARARFKPPYNARAEWVALDIERYKVWPFVMAASYEESLNKFADIAQRFRQASAYPFCFYGAFPTGGPVWTGWVDRKAGVREQWDAGRELAERTLVPHVDALCPSLYAFYGSAEPERRQRDIEAWQTFARVTIEQARRAAPGKPVFPFIWPQYHEAGNRTGNPYLEEDFWRAQIELLMELADGVVLWGGYQQAWEEHAPWWQTLQALTGVQASVVDSAVPAARQR